MKQLLIALCFLMLLAVALAEPLPLNGATVEPISRLKAVQAR